MSTGGTYKLYLGQQYLWLQLGNRVGPGVRGGGRGRPGVSRKGCGGGCEVDRIWGLERLTLPGDSHSWICGGEPLRTTGSLDFSRPDSQFSDGMLNVTLLPDLIH